MKKKRLCLDDFEAIHYDPSVKVCECCKFVGWGTLLMRNKKTGDELYLNTVCATHARNYSSQGDMQRVNATVRTVLHAHTTKVIDDMKARGEDPRVGYPKDEGVV